MQNRLALQRSNLCEVDEEKVRENMVKIIMPLV